MEPRSSIFSFDTFQGAFRPTLAIPVAVGILLLARLIFEPLRGVPDYDNADFSRFVAAERYEWRDAPGTPQILLLGSSRTQYGFDKTVLADSLMLPVEDVRNLSMPNGNPWSGATLLRRNRGLLPAARIIVIDIAPGQLNGGMLPLANRFAHLATLDERIRVDKRDGFRAEQVGDWFIGHLGIRRSLRSYGLTVVNMMRGTIWGANDRELLDPYWTRESDHEKLKREMFTPNTDWNPENYPKISFGDYHESQFLRDAVIEIESIAAEAGVPVIFHEPPFHPGFMDSIRANPDWSRQYDAYREFFEGRASDKVSVIFWDETENLGIPAGAIMDYGHYGKEAAQIYSAVLGDLIGEILDR